MNKKILKTFLLGAVFSLGMSVTAFAASANMQGSAETTAKGKEISGNTLSITLNGNEVQGAADSIHIVLDGAQWKGLDKTGSFSRGINYEKISAEEIVLHITPNEEMLSKGCTAAIPLNCDITKDIANVTATVKWGLREYDDRVVTIAKCKATNAYLSGGVREHKTGDKIFKKGGSELAYNKLKINVIGHDTRRTQNKITITYDGAEWSDYGDEGKIETDHGNIRFEKVNSKTIRLKIDDLTQNQKPGYTATIPLSGTITGSGDIKAIVDYGVDDIPQSTVVFAHCADGEMTVKAVSPETPVDMYSRVSDLVFTDTGTNSYKNNTKIELEISHAYHFAQAPTVKGEGKFADKCSIQINKENDKKLILNIGSIASGETGSITVKDLVIKRGEKNEPNTEAIKMTVTSNAVNEKLQVGKFVKGSADYKQGYTITVKNANAQANDKFAFLDTISISDSSAAAYQKGDKTEFSFDSGFKWFTNGKMPTVTASGKFADKCAFEYDENAEKAYLVFTDDIPAQEGGSIEISGAVLEKADTEEFVKVYMTAGLVGKTETYTTTQAAKYSSFSDKEPDVPEKVDFVGFLHLSEMFEGFAKTTDTVKK